ncbi:NAD(P)/FAD-dependent oxidoreductase [Pseudomonas sp. R5(2019)]|uniref:NAD(P)/FAD-dependent oxidoreductase n=1 Tax=Pseudomonas sp. R5(2019) TaxID=2697566 RepID=UPI00141312D2|nr:FAD-dependent oxidoreductase [Pseudomonas sp. R5(2019)]NBA94843.1 FAD-dependent oxidoreductase [Pseudomonas sp. R5(2019)]
MSVRRIAIVGAGHAGGRVAQHLIELDSRCQVLLIGDEPYAPYERPALSKAVLAGEQAWGELMLAADEFWTAHDRLVRMTARVVGLDSDQRCLRLDDGRQVEFDELVVATGGVARSLKVPGGDLPGLHVLRGIGDCEKLAGALESGSRLLVIGAGVIGMEVAATASGLGVAVTVLDVSDQVMRRCLPAAVSQWLAAQHQHAGVVLKSQVGVQSIVHDGAVYQVQVQGLEGRCEVLEAEQVLLAIGIDCDTGFLEQTGITCVNGVVVDAFCRSPDASWCYAVGDVANCDNAFYGRPLRQETWRNAENQALAVAQQIVGAAQPYSEIPWMWTDQFGHNIQVVGLIDEADGHVWRGDLAQGKATMVLLKECRVVAAVMVNQGKERKALEALIRGRRQIDEALLSDVSVSLKAVAA